MSAHFRKRLEVTKEAVAKSANSTDNAEKRRLFSLLQILRLDIEADPKAKESDVNIMNEIDELCKTLNLTSPSPSKNPLVILETSLRFIGCCCTFILMGTFVSLPLLLLNFIDEMTNADPFDRFSQKVKRAVGWTFLAQSGLEVTVEGTERENFESQCTLLTFNHASNLDGFIMSATCPIKQLAFGKKELFAVPFFSWLSLAVGGVPVDRNHRDRAVGALKRTAEAAKGSKMSIAVAPEGTRSTTGQLNPFKKGTFYMWEELNAPVVPVVTFGAFDVYPRKAWVNQTGHVTVRYLKPIYPSEAKDRDEMMALLRRRMLESMMECPSNIGKPVSFFRRASSLMYNIMMIAALVVIFRKLSNFLVEQMGYSWGRILGVGSGVTVSITVALYIYYVYIVHIGSKPSAKSADKKQK